jgi:hypothetical protein
MVAYSSSKSLNFSGKEALETDLCLIIGAPEGTGTQVGRCWPSAEKKIPMIRKGSRNGLKGKRFRLGLEHF